jgi:molybdopterin-guanine dinucleotide biosynthesis protein A
MAVAATYEADGSMHMQPVFCLMRANLLNSLLQFIHQGGRKLGTWAASQEAVWVPFEEPSIQMAGPAPNKQLPHLTYPNAFCNVNTLEDLRRLEQAL